MALINFGDFDMLDEYFKNSTEFAERLNSINITKLMVEAMPSCGEFFVNKCWWHTKYYNCCTLFEFQRTEYGFCYSFNSETSDIHIKNVNKFEFTYELDSSRPRRTSTSGKRGGLRLTVNLPPKEVSNIIEDDFILVTSPYSFPMVGSDIPAGSSAQVLLSAKTTKPTPQVRGLSSDRRHCLFRDEGKALGKPKYFHTNCLAECHRESAYEYCNCTPYFYPNE
ncbi:hypothetical protein L9F63_000220, partial [Diploptera punctata]